MMRTYKFRLKSKNLRYLDKAKRDVNFVWNYCNDVAIQYLDKHNKWLTKFDLQSLTKGCSKQLHIDSRTIQSISHRFANRRLLYKKRKLSWRSEKRSLGWIPIHGESIKITKDTFTYKKVEFRFWRSQEIQGEVRSGSFSQDSLGRWYISLCCLEPKRNRVNTGQEVGIDLGLKTIATLSTGEKLSRENITISYAPKLAKAQRAGKKRQISKIHTKIKNVRKDWNHKQTTKIINNFDRVIVGNISPSKLKSSRFAKSVTDVSWADFKSMLAYKAIALGVEFKEVKENFSTVTCSSCFERTGPSGLSALGVREWTCKCGVTHSRDVNAAKNILRFGCESPKGAFKGDTTPWKPMLKATPLTQPLNDKQHSCLSYLRSLQNS